MEHASISHVRSERRKHVQITHRCSGPGPRISSPVSESGSGAAPAADRPYVMRRRILTILTVTCVAGAAISAAMWVRSLVAFDQLTWTGPTERWLLSSAHAQLAFTISGGADWTGEPRFGRSVGSPRPDSITSARDAGWSRLRTHVDHAGFVVWSGSVGERFVTSVVVPWWSVAALVSVLPALRLVCAARRIRAAGRCGRCGYDLRATPERCPECGTVAQAARPPHNPPMHRTGPAV
jgi:hypothetical protein